MVLLFIGPTGTGKTSLAKQLSHCLFGTDTIATQNMSEFTERQDVAKLFGSPPGYIGHGTDTKFIQEIKNRDGHLVILFDEIEKAAPEVKMSLMQILDTGALTTGNNETLDVTSSIIILTSNALSNILGKKLKIGIGIDAEEREYNIDDIKELLIRDQVFSPEFINRIDSVIKFKSITKGVARSIFIQRLKKLAAELSIKDVEFTWDNVLVDTSLQRYEIEYGGRSIERLINIIKQNAVQDIISGQKKVRGKLRNGS